MVVGSPLAKSSTVTVEVVSSLGTEELVQSQ